MSLCSRLKYSLYFESLRIGLEKMVRNNSRRKGRVTQALEMKLQDVNVKHDVKSGLLCPCMDLLIELFDLVCVLLYLFR